MSALMWVTAIFAGLVHVLIFCMESLWWTTPKVRARFRQTPEGAEATRLFAFNQGFYNLFLAGGTFAGLALVLMEFTVEGWLLVSWNCLFMVGAAIVLVVSAPKMWRGALIQGTAPLIFVVLAAVQLLG